MGIEVYIHMLVNTRLMNGPLLFVSLHSDMCGACAVPRVVSIWRYEGRRRVSCFTSTSNTKQARGARCVCDRAQLLG